MEQGKKIGFSKIFWPSMTAVLIGMVLTAAVWILIAAGILYSFDVEPVRVQQGSVLVIDMAEDITDSPRISPLTDFDMQTLTPRKTLTLLEAVGAIEHAAGDERIVGICINPSGGGTASAAVVEELRAAVERFKLSGKFVVAYADSYTQGQYYLASAADRIYVQPQGEIDWRGISFTVPFFRSLLDRLGVKTEVFRPAACPYKSAVEPYVMTRMSDENRSQMTALAESAWKTILDQVSASRGIPVERLDAAADDLSAMMPQQAVRLGMIDDTIYEDEFDTLLGTLGAAADKDGSHRRIPLDLYISTLVQLNGYSENTIALIYADGQILDGDMESDGYVFGTALASKLRRARTDADIKSVVLRVNSPGGSALASDIVWREMELLRQVKPVVVSMGEYAASGGYYISAPADVIVADRMTVTGSIGVYGIMFDLGNALSSKLGITFDGVKTNPSADMSMLRGVDATERKAIMRGVDRVYDTFTRLVAEGRNLPLERVMEIAGGKVWSGSDAVEIGLADTNGGLSEALAIAADKAGIADDYSIYEFRMPPSPLETWIELLTSTAVEAAGLDMSDMRRAGMVRDMIVENPFLATDRGIQTLMPLNIKLMNLR